MALHVTLNGQNRSFDGLAPGASLAELVGTLGVQGDRIALELNGEIVPRAKWPGAVLASDDRLEMVHFVGGGSGCLC